MIDQRTPAGRIAVDSQMARETAGDYLIRRVGDLLKPGIPRLLGGDHWVMPIVLGNALQGELGEVGRISVDAVTGKVLFSEEDHAEVENRAAQLAEARTL